MGSRKWRCYNPGIEAFCRIDLSFPRRKRQTGRGGTWGARRTGEDCIKEDNLVSTIVIIIMRTIE